MSKRVRVGVFGSTGSIGTQTLDVIRRNAQAYEVVFLTIQGSVDRLIEQIHEFQPKAVAITDPSVSSLHFENIVKPRVYQGSESLTEILRNEEIDIAVMGVTGFAAFAPVIAALEAGVHIALANKEVLVAASCIVRAVMKTSSSRIVPVDSEHNSIFQCMLGRSPEHVNRVTLTASGGPFYSFTQEELECVTPKQAIQHPNWAMGTKISVDSATLMNKGLEVIEAAALFDLPGSAIDVVIHPQSVVHALVEYTEGTSIAALYLPDMRVPIAFALDYLRAIVDEKIVSIESGAQALNLASIGTLSFYPPDTQRFPCLALAYRALQEGGSAPAVLNAANEVAVEAFCREHIRFTDISKIVENVLNQLGSYPVESIAEIIKVDANSRCLASEEVEKIQMQLRV